MCSSWSKDGSLGPAERDPPGRRGAGSEAVSGGDARDPGDLVAGEDDRHRGAPLARDLAVGEQVLQRAAAAEAEWTHPVAGPPRADGQGRAEPVGVERAVVGFLAAELAGA